MSANANAIAKSSVWTEPKGSLELSKTFKKVRIVLNFL